MVYCNIMTEKKTKKETNQAYYERQRGNKPPKRAPKSASERMREYRARKKRLLNAPKASEPIPSSAIPADKVELSGTIGTPSRDDGPDLIHDILPHSDSVAHESERKEFKKKSLDSASSEAGNICDRLWFRNDLKTIQHPYCELLQNDFFQTDIMHFQACIKAEQESSENAEEDGERDDTKNVMCEFGDDGLDTADSQIPKRGRWAGKLAVHKTSAQSMREYRLRQKGVDPGIHQMINSPEPVTLSTLVKLSDTLGVKVPKSDAQRAKEYRQRKKEGMKPKEESLPERDNGDTKKVMPTMFVEVSTCKIKVPKTDAQRAKEYRQRKKEAKLREKLQASLIVETSQLGTDIPIKPDPSDLLTIEEDISLKVEPSSSDSHEQRTQFQQEKIVFSGLPVLTPAASGEGVRRSDEEPKRNDSEPGLWIWVRAQHDVQMENSGANGQSCEDEILGF